MEDFFDFRQTISALGEFHFSFYHSGDTFEKKLMRTIYLILGLVLFTEFCHAQWNRQSPMPFPPFGAQDMAFVPGTSRGYIAGEYLGAEFGAPGQMLETTDGGLTWHARILNQSGDDMNTVFFLDGNHGWVAGNIGYRTIDGGSTWTLMQGLPVGSHYHLHFLDQNFGYSISNGGLQITDDGGDTWTYHGFNNGNLNAADFLNPSQGLAWGAGGLMKTTDGGNNWDQVFGAVLGARVLSAGNAVAFNGTQLYHSSDGWESWTQVYTGSWPDFAVPYIVQLDDNKLLLYNTQGDILYSNDAGASWAISSGLPNNEGVYSHYKVDASTILLFDIGGGIHKSTDAGISWVQVMTGSGLPIWTGAQDDANQLWAAGNDGIIVKSEDQGDTWTYFSSGVAGVFRDIGFFDDQTGLAVGTDGKILRTLDAGENWDPTVFGYDHQRLFLLDDQVAFTTGEYTITRTLDRGDSWEPINLPFFASYYGDVHALTPDDFRVVTYYAEAAIYHPNDGGITWDLEYWDNGHPMFGIQMWDTQTGWAVGPADGLFRTANAGASWDWIPFAQNAPGGIYDVQFINPQVGWISGEGGFIAKSTDGGFTWTDHTYQGSQWFDHIENMIVLSGNEVIAATIGGDIIHTIDGGVTWSVENIEGPVQNAWESIAMTDQGMWVSGGEIWQTSNFQAILPVELTNFTASCHEDKILLNWIVAHQANFSFFTIEYSSNSVEWDEVSVVYPKETRPPVHYESVFPKPVKGQRTYIRLKMTDADGQFEYSEIRTLDCGPEETFEMNLSPNPVLSGEPMLVESVGSPGKLMRWEIFNLQGRILLSGKSENNERILVPTSQLSAGTYLFQTLKHKGQLPRGTKP